jgi:hypothetical protein
VAEATGRIDRHDVDMLKAAGQDVVAMSHSVATRT